MTQLKSAYEITMELSELFHNKDRPNEEVQKIVYEYSKIFAEELLTAPEAFTGAFMALRAEISN